MNKTPAQEVPLRSPPPNRRSLHLSLPVCLLCPAHAYEAGGGGGRPTLQWLPEMPLVSLLPHYNPLCVLCEWLMMIMQMSPSESSMGNYHSRDWGFLKFSDCRRGNHGLFGVHVRAHECIFGGFSKLAGLWDWGHGGGDCQTRLCLLFRFPSSFSSFSSAEWPHRHKKPKFNSVDVQNCSPPRWKDLREWISSLHVTNMTRLVFMRCTRIVCPVSSQVQSPNVEAQHGNPGWWNKKNLCFNSFSHFNTVPVLHSGACCSQKRSQTQKNSLNVLF